MDKQWLIIFSQTERGTYGFKYDFVGKPDGAYTARVKAHNSGGWGDWSDLINFTLPQK